MANITISAFEIAQLFGLEYLGEIESDTEVDRYGWSLYYHKFTFQNIELKIPDCECAGPEHAKDMAGEKVLLAIGALVKDL